MEHFEQDSLAAALRELRPAPDPEFAAELDQRAAAGFPRPGGASAPSPWRRLAARLRALPPRRTLIPVGATALAAIVAVTVAVSLTQSGSDTARREGGFLSAMSPNERPVPESAPESSAANAEAAGATGATAGPMLSADQGFTGSRGSRQIERSATLVLGAEPAEVEKAAGRVFEAVHANRGIVLRSSVSGGAEDAGARFELLIPSPRLGDAMAAFSEIAEVRSRHEATADITAPVVGTSERLRDSRARIDGLLAQLAAADTDSEREAVEAELATERRHAANLRARLANLQRRADFSRVSLRIESGDSGPVAPSEDGSWGVADALGDAGRLLSIAAGVAIVALALLAPLALIALLAWLTHRAFVRRARERTLG